MGSGSRIAPAPPEIGIERQAGAGRGRLGDRHGDAQNGVGAQPPLVGRAVQLNHHGVDFRLPLRGHAQHFRRDDLVDVMHCLQHAFAAVTFLVSVAHFDGLVLSGGSARAPGP